MALGRVSPFSELARNNFRGENLPGTAESGPSSFADLDTFSRGGGEGIGTPAGNANVTGVNASLAGQGASFASMLGGFPGIGSVTGPAVGAIGQGVGGVPGGVIGSLLGSFLGNSVQSAAIGKGLSAASAKGGLASSDPSTAASPVAFTGFQGNGLPSLIGNIAANMGAGKLAAMFGLDGLAASLNAPSFTGQANVAPGVNANLGTEFAGLAPTSYATPVHSPSPNTGSPVGFSSGMAANGISMGSTFGGPNVAPGIFGSFGPGPVGLGTGVATGAGTGNASIGNGAAGNGAGVGLGLGFGGEAGLGGKGLGETGSGGTVGTPSDPSNADAAVAADGPGPASGGVGGTAGDGSGTGNGASGDGSGPGGQGGAHEGGFIDLENSPNEATDQQPDAQQGSEATEGPMNVETGEFIVNKEVAGRFGPLLNKLNDLGRNKQLQNFLGDLLNGAAKTGFDALMNGLKR